MGDHYCLFPVSLSIQTTIKQSAWLHQAFDEEKQRLYFMSLIAEAPETVVGYICGSIKSEIVVSASFVPRYFKTSSVKNIESTFAWILRNIWATLIGNTIWF